MPVAKAMREARKIPKKEWGISAYIRVSIQAAPLCSRDV